MGIVFGLLAGFLDATKNVLAKKDTGKYSESTINFAWMLFATFLTLPLAFFAIPRSISLTLVVTFMAVTVLDFFAYICYLRSLKYTDLSLSLPMLALTPVFVLIISYLFLRQTVSYIGFGGVLLIIVGSYILNLKKGHQSFFAPFLNIYHDKGVRYMLYTSLLWGGANSLHKIGITESSPLFYLGISYLLLSILYFLMLLREKREELRVFTNLTDIRVLAPVGILEGLTSLFQYLSQGLLTSSVLTISLKRSSILFSALFGYLLFKENIKERLFPILLILLGVILISI